MRYAGPHLRYLGGAVDESTDSRAETRETIDAEVRRIVGEQFARAAALLSARRAVLNRLATDLLKSESLDGVAVREALAEVGQIDAVKSSVPAGETLRQD